MLDCTARIDAQPSIGNAYYPGFIYTQPPFPGSYPVKSDPQNKDYLQTSSAGSPTHYPHSPVDSRPESLPSSQSPVYHNPHHITQSSAPYYYPYNTCKSYPAQQHKDVSAAPQFSKSDNSLPQYAHQHSLSPNSIHGSPSSGSAGSLSNSPSPLTDTKPVPGLYWPAPAAIPPQYGITTGAGKPPPSPADYGMFQHLHHQGMYIVKLVLLNNINQHYSLNHDHRNLQSA